MDRVLVSRVKPEGVSINSRRSETNIDVWTHWVAITHKARNNKGPIYGWCSWYDRTTKISLLDVYNQIKHFWKLYRLMTDIRLWMAHGMQTQNFHPGCLALQIEFGKRVFPGVWFAPLMINPEHPWKKANPAAIQSNAKGISSFMNPNPFHPAGANWINPISTGFWENKLVQALRLILLSNAAGEDMYSFLSRTTNPWSCWICGCLRMESLRFLIFNRVWWNNDADVSYLDDVELVLLRRGYMANRGNCDDF